MSKNKVFICTFTFVFIAFLWINTQEISPKYDQELKEKNYWTKKTHATSKHDLVIISDSRGLRGINPEFFIGFESPLNFSYRSAGLSVSYIKLALKRLKKGGTLLIALTPISLVDEHMSNDHLQEYLKMSIDEVWISSNYQILKLLSPITSDKFKFKKKNFFSKTFYSNGFVATLPKKFEIDKGLETYKEQFKQKEINLKNIKAALKFLREKGIKTISFRMVSSKEMEEVENKHGKFNVNQVQKLFEEYQMQWISIKDRFKYETYDASHLSPKSAEVFSKDLAELL